MMGLLGIVSSPTLPEQNRDVQITLQLHGGNKIFMLVGLSGDETMPICPNKYPHVSVK